MTSAASGARVAPWLLDPPGNASAFTPEMLSEEHRLIRQTADEFMTNEVLPGIDRLERKDWTFARELVVKCGELGLLGTDVAEDYGGLAMDKVSSLIVGESVGRLASFATIFGAQTGLSITPLLCFGTPAQKQRYLPRLVTGELLGAYALSESGAGSDALGARARADRNPDGSFTLTGEKMWITSGGFADVFIVFAKVDGEAFTAFIVERAFGGVTSGHEEHKMGLHGSSTTPLILQEVRVPAENVLGEIGRGHKVAFNVLNYGRFKLAAMCSGAARFIIGEAAKYAAQRRQFGKSIAEFGAIRHKLSEMTARQYALESMLYRIAGSFDTALDGRHDDLAVLSALEEHAIEASIVKVAGSEMLDYVVDENVQIHGGNGFVRDYPAERHYRDARVNRIFEGTNEINRLLIPAMLLRRKPDVTTENTGSVDPLAVMKATAGRVLSTAAATYGTSLGEQQQVLSWAADILIDVFACDSVRARASAAPASGDPLHEAIAALYINGAAARVEVAARNALAAMLDGATLAAAASQLRSSFDLPPLNTVPLRDQIAGAVVSRGKYPFA